MIKGYIFDMDGTLIDSMGMLCRIDREIFVRLGLTATEDALEKMKYITLRDSAKFISDSFELPMTESEISEILMNTMRDGYLGVEMKHGVREYLDFCKSRGVKMCIATATETDIASEVAERLDFMKYMETLVSCTDVGASKSKPDVFLQCAARMGLDASECAVFEDGLPGAESAKGAGFTVVGVYDATAADDESEKLKRISDRYIRSFDDIKNKLI